MSDASAAAAAAPAAAVDASGASPSAAPAAAAVRVRVEVEPTMREQLDDQAKRVRRRKSMHWRSIEASGAADGTASSLSAPFPLRRSLILPL